MNKLLLLLLLLIILIIIMIINKRLKKELFNTKRILKLKFGSTFYLPLHKKERHNMQSVQQFIDYFLPNIYDYEIVNNNEKSDITIWDIYLDDSSHLRNDEINMLICVENVDHWNWYKHYSKYGNYGDKKMNVYLYNHIDKIEENINYIAIPMIHNYINYYNTTYLENKPTEITFFSEKKFCLMINKSNLNKDIDNINDVLSKIDIVDNISMYDSIKDTSAYNSVELLNVFNKYKFIICFENSYKDGYITEKIFNCFFAHTLPIYKGSEKINDYINEKSFINARDTNFIEQIKQIKNNEELYNQYIQSQKINNMYNNEGYQNKLLAFIDKKINK